MITTRRHTRARSKRSSGTTKRKSETNASTTRPLKKKPGTKKTLDEKKVKYKSEASYGQIFSKTDLTNSEKMKENTKVKKTNEKMKEKTNEKMKVKKTNEKMKVKKTNEKMKVMTEKMKEMTEKMKEMTEKMKEMTEKMKEKMKVMESRIVNVNHNQVHIYNQMQDNKNFLRTTLWNKTKDNNKMLCVLTKIPPPEVGRCKKYRCGGNIYLDGTCSNPGCNSGYSRVLPSSDLECTM